MKKSLLTFVTACLMAGAMTMTAFAGQWQPIGAGWAYQNDDGSYLNSGWNWVEGKCYYFDSNGFILQNITTPDGLTVDSDGAWVVNGTVQTQEAQNTGTTAALKTISLGNLTFSIPDGYTEFSSDEDGYYAFINASSDSAIAYFCVELTDMEGREELLNALQDPLLDMAMGNMEQMVGPLQQKSTAQLASGTWYCYQYGNTFSKVIPGTITVYARISGAQAQMFFFVGELSPAAANVIMSNQVR